MRTSRQFGDRKKFSSSPMASPNPWSKTGLGLKGDSPDTALSATNSPQPRLSAGGCQEARAADLPITKTPHCIPNPPGSTQGEACIELPGVLASMPAAVVEKKVTQSQPDARKLSPTASSFQPSSNFLFGSHHSAPGGYAPPTSPYAVMTSELSSADLGVSRHLLFTSSNDTVVPADVDVFMEVSAPGKELSLAS